MVNGLEDTYTGRHRRALRLQYINHERHRGIEDSD